MNKPITFNKFVTDTWSMVQMLIEEAVLAEPVACKTLCELCVKRGYFFCANAVKTTPITAPPQRKPHTA